MGVNALRSDSLRGFVLCFEKKRWFRETSLVFDPWSCWWCFLKFLFAIFVTRQSKIPLPPRAPLEKHVMNITFGTISLSTLYRHKIHTNCYFVQWNVLRPPSPAALFIPVVQVNCLLLLLLLLVVLNSSVCWMWWLVIPAVVMLCMLWWWPGWWRPNIRGCCFPTQLGAAAWTARDQ